MIIGIESKLGHTIYMKICKLVVISIIIFLGCLLVKQKIQAQDIAGGLARRMAVRENTFDGAVLCSMPQGVELCKTAYSEDMFGVAVNLPTAVIENIDDQSNTNVLSDGTATIRVNEINGAIKRGDYLTSSEQPGLAMKAQANGYVLGVAIEDQKSGLEPTVRAVINIHVETSLQNTPSNLIAVLREASSAPVLAPLAAWRYLIAALLVVMSFMMGFVYFGRNARAGVEAVGRNPLAEKMIRRNVALNMIVTVMIVVSGLFCAYLVLIL